MMGRREDRQGQFFYEFNLDEVVPPDHLVRKIDAVLDLGWVHKELAPYYSHTGRPSIDPVLMIRMLIVGYVFAIRSERRICAEVQVNLAYRWYCRLSVEDKIPDHSVFSRARHERFRESDALRRVFERVVGLCIAAGLVGGEAFSIDASLIEADVDKKKRSGGDQPIKWPTPEEASHAVREYLAALDAACRDEESGGGDGGGSGGSGGGKPPKQISLTDPQAAWVARKGVDPFFAYDANYLIDNRFGIILDAGGRAPIAPVREFGPGGADVDIALLVEDEVSPRAELAAITLAHAEVEAAVREQIERGSLLGEQRRIVPGQHHYRRTEAYALRASGKIAQEVERRGELPDALGQQDIVDVLAVAQAVADNGGLSRGPSPAVHMRYGLSRLGRMAERHPFLKFQLGKDARAQAAIVMHNSLTLKN